MDNNNEGNKTTKIIGIVLNGMINILENINKENDNRNTKISSIVDVARGIQSTSSYTNNTNHYKNKNFSKTQPCRNYAKGKCEYGSKCKYSHHYLI